MKISKKYHSLKVPFIDFVPAEVQGTNGDSWRIVFYVRKPGTDQMQRFRRRVKNMGSKQARMRYAKKICSEINKKLYDGWTPFVDGYASKEYKLLREVFDQFLEQCERRCRDNLMRPDSVRAYTSYIKNISLYMQENGKEDMFTVEFDKKFVLNFLDYIYFDRKRSARTSNNYLFFCKQLAIFMKDRDYISVNPTDGIDRRKVGKKKREIIPPHIRNQIFIHLAEHNRQYLTLCLTVYFCFIRRTEISKLRVRHVDIANGTISIPAEISKNKKDGVVTIPKKLKDLLVNHLNESTSEDFLFSQKDFKPGAEQLQPKKISDEWALMRKVLKFKQEYQFYSLKDTGITELFRLNVPTIKIRDQARHHDIKITETYTPRNYEADETLLDLDFNF